MTQRVNREKPEIQLFSVHYFCKADLEIVQRQYSGELMVDDDDPKHTCDMKGCYINEVVPFLPKEEL